jgi:hypothetical protein
VVLRVFGWVSEFFPDVLLVISARRRVDVVGRGRGLGLCHTVMSQGTLCLQVVMRGLEKLGQPQQVSMNLFIYIYFLQFAKIYNLY